MANIYQLGRKGQVYGKLEAGGYGVDPTFGSANAFRHLMVKIKEQAKNRVNAPEKKQTPGVMNRFDRRKTASWEASGLMYPSATLNTLPESNFLLEPAFGSKRNVTLSAVVAASPAPTTTVFTVDSVTGLAVKDFVLINCTGGSSPGLYLRQVTAINTLALTVAPALPQAPVSTNTVKGALSYAFTTDLMTNGSIRLGHYLPDYTREAAGCIVEKFGFVFDGNDEPRFSFSGPAQQRSRPAQTKPVAFTTVGGGNAIPSGIKGHFFLNGVAYKILKFAVDVEKGVFMEGLENIGDSLASGAHQSGERKVSLAVDARVTDDTAFMAAAEAESDASAFCQVGGGSSGTEGRIWALYAPVAEFTQPDEDDGDQELSWNYKGIARESAGNDELYLAMG